MNVLGVYFGPQVISIVEIKGKKIVNSIQIPRLSVSAGDSDLEEKVPDEVKLVALFKDELRRNNISAKELYIGLSGQDLIIRTFELPLFLPRDELQNAVNFEARKYIPFKVEDLISDFHLRADKLNRRNIILFVGIKKEIINKYLSIAKQLDVKLKFLEYSAFSVLRFLKLAGISTKGITGVIAADLKERDEVNFVVLEKDFPLFSHEINLTTESGKPADNGIETEMIEKLKTEISVSIDYYNRKFPHKFIEKMFLVSAQDYRLELEAYLKEMGLSTQFIDPGFLTRYMDKFVPFSLSFIKGYSASLSNVIRIPIKINLLLKKVKAAEEAAAKPKIFPSYAALKLEPRIIVFSLLICLAPFVYGSYRTQLLRKELDSLKGMRAQITTIGPTATYEELMSVDSEYKRKLDILDNLIKKQLYLTEMLNVMPQALPDGLWLTRFYFKKLAEDKAEVVLEGMVYLAQGDSDKEFIAVNQFVANLKENPMFNKYFKQINIRFIEHRQIKNITVANFSISCRI